MTAVERHMKALVARIERLQAVWLVCVLLGSFALAAMYAASQQCATFDETAHLPAGYSYLRTGDYRLNPEHPPLAKLLAATPLLALRGVTFSTSSREWREADAYAFGQRFLYRDNDAAQLLFWGRLPMVLLACWLGFLMFRWLDQWHGRRAAMIALVLFALTPDFLAHGALVTTDAPAAAFVFATFYFLWRMLGQLRVRDTLSCGIALGAALASKFSTLVFVPLLVLLALARALRPAPLGACATRRARFAALSGACAVIGCVALGVIWASYGFHAALPEQAGRAVLDWRDVAPESPAVASAAVLERRLHLVPDTYLFGVLYVLRHAADRPSFLLGEHSMHGFHSYFVHSVLVKTPLPELLLIALGCAMVARDVRRRRFVPAVLLLPATLHFGLALSSHLNIGHRHLLPMYPFLLVLAAAAAAECARRIMPAFGVIMLLAWLACGTAAVSPSYLAYFNELAHGTRGGVDWLVDSNLDWGQDLPALARWMKTRGVHKIYLSYFGSAPPEYYGIEYEPLPSYFDLPKPRRSRDPNPARFLAVSATNLQELYLRGAAPPEFLELLDRLRTRKQPAAVLGGSIYVYDLGIEDQKQAAASRHMLRRRDG